MMTTSEMMAAQLTKSQAMTAMVVRAMAQGLTAKQALEVVCGKTVVDAMVASLYNELRARVAKPAEVTP